MLTIGPGDQDSVLVPSFTQFPPKEIHYRGKSAPKDWDAGRGCRRRPGSRSTVRQIASNRPLFARPMSHLLSVPVSPMMFLENPRSEASPDRTWACSLLTIFPTASPSLREACCRYRNRMRLHLYRPRANADLRGPICQRIASVVDWGRVTESLRPVGATILFSRERGHASAVRHATD
jgi:hypothetical protein